MPAKEDVSGVLAWGAVIAIIGVGYALGLDPRTCGIALLAIVATLYFWGQS